MSIKVQNAVWLYSSLQGEKLLVLLALADWANDDGYCWPSMAKIAKKARITERGASRIISSFRESGIIEVVQEGGGRGKVPVYRIKGDSESGFEFLNTPTVDTETPTVDAAKPRPKLHRYKEEPSLEPSDKNNHQAAGSSLFGNEEIVSSPKKGSKAPFVLPDWIPAETWKDYEEMRRVLRKPMTDRAKSLAVKELMRFKMDGHSPESILSQSILNSWQGLYAPKDDSGFRSNYQPPVTPRQKSPSEQLREQGIVPGGRSGR